MLLQRIAITGVLSNTSYQRLQTIFEKRMSGVQTTSLWSSDNVVQSPYNDIDIPDMTIPEYVWRNLKKWSNKTAVICAETDRKYIYNEIYNQAQKLGATLRKKYNIKNGDTIVVMLPNLPEYPTIILGILTAGATATTLNPLLTLYEVQQHVSMPNPKIAIALLENVPILNEALKGIPIIVLDIMNDRPDGTVSYKEIMNNYIDINVLNDVKVTVDDVALLLYSSGTTGLPKCVELTHRNIIANCEQLNSEGCRHYSETTETNQDVVLAYVPMFHIYGMGLIMIHKLSLGLKLVTLPKFHLDTFVSALEKHKLNILYMVPPTVMFLARSPKVKTKHFENLKSSMVGAASTALVDINKFLEKVGHEIHFGQGYGLTETSVATLVPVESKDYVSVGKAVSNVKLRIVDSKMNNLGPNELGELLIKGPSVMKGYRNNDEANSQIFVDNVWLRTGDLASIDDTGTVTIADRLKELIKVNAYQVAPAELENVIKKHPAVMDAAVIGIPDDKKGEQPKAFIILNQEVTVTEKELMEYVAERVAPYKKLKEIKFVETIHKNPNGKILRRLLLEEHLKNQN